jgi:hypothetical protein
MPFEKGQVSNPNGNNGKPFRDALRMELAAAGDDHRALREIAANLIQLAKLRDTDALPAIREVADRTDGKVPTPVGGTDELPPLAMQTIERTIVDPKVTGADSAGVDPATDPGKI